MVLNRGGDNHFGLILHSHLCFVLCGCIFSLKPNTTGEQKTKPTQNSVRELRGLGLSADLVGSQIKLILISASQMDIKCTKH